MHGLQLFMYYHFRRSCLFSVPLLIGLPEAITSAVSNELKMWSQELDYYKRKATTSAQVAVLCLSKDLDLSQQTSLRKGETMSCMQELLPDKQRNAPQKPEKSEPIKQDFAEFLLDLMMQLATDGTMQQALAGWDAKRFESERNALLRRELPYFRCCLGTQ